MELKVLDGDRFFNDSPNAGEPDCICSRCHKQIKEEEIPLRVFCDREVIYAKNDTSGEEKGIEAVDGYEFRLCESCQKSIGIIGL